MTGEAVLLEKERELLWLYGSGRGEEGTSGRLYTDGYELIDMRRVIGISTWDVFFDTCYVWIPWHPVAKELMNELERQGRTWVEGPTGEFVSEASKSIGLGAYDAGDEDVPDAG